MNYDKNTINSLAIIHFPFAIKKKKVFKEIFDKSFDKVLTFAKL